MDTWTKYESLIRHWRPEFGNADHIRARDMVAEIVRLSPQYAALKAKKETLKTKAGRQRPNKRLDALYNELTTLKRRVIEIIETHGSQNAA